MNAIKKLCAAVLAAALIAGMGAAFAAEVPADRDADAHAQHMQQLQDKWEALTDRQRRAVYKLFERKGRAETALMEEYAALGLITSDEAEEYAERVEDWLEALEDSGKLPPVFGHTRRSDGGSQSTNGRTA